jgi:hypothetical protein
MVFQNLTVDAHRDINISCKENKIRGNIPFRLFFLILGQIYRLC